MATSSEIGAIFSVLVTNYGYITRDKTDTELSALLDIWKQTLADIDSNVLKASALQHISESKWFPSVAELRDAAAEIMTPNRTTPVEQWGEVLRQMKHVGYYGVPYFADETTSEVVSDMGWRNLCLSEDGTADRARFIQGYIDRKKREQHKAVQLPQVADAIARLADRKRMQLRSGTK